MEERGGNIPKKKNRKTRSDKKRSVNPYLTIETKENLTALARFYSFRMGRKISVGEMGAGLIQKILYHPPFFNQVKDHFVRSFDYSDEDIYFGHIDAPPILIKKLGETKRQPVRLKQPIHRRLADLSYSLDVQWGPCAAFLIEQAFEYPELIRDFVPDFKKLSVQRVHRLYQGGLLRE